MARATQLGAVSFCSASTLDPSYSYIELVEYHSEPQRMRRSPVTDIKRVSTFLNRGIFASIVCY
jgi:hypothetical protein